jgi:hypothetical protein
MDAPKSDVGSSADRPTPVLPRHLHEILNNLDAILGEHGLRVELHALDGKRLMAHPHNLSVVVCGGSYDESRRQTFPGDHKGVVTRCSKGIWHAFEQPFAIVAYHRGLAVHDAARPRYHAPSNLTNRLMAEADPKDGGLTTAAEGETHHVETDSTSIRCARSWREHNCLGRQLSDLRNRDFIVAFDNHCFAKLPQVLNEVIGKAVVVVDNENHCVSLTGEGWQEN